MAERDPQHHKHHWRGGRPSKRASEPGRSCAQYLSRPSRYHKHEYRDATDRTCHPLGGSRAAVSASPGSLTFNYEAGSLRPPQAQSVQVSSTGGSAQFTTASTGLNGAPDFLTVDTASGITPGSVSVRLNAATLATLASGEYQGACTIFSPGFSGGSQRVTVTLVVTPPGPKITALVSSASLAQGPVSPGEMVTLFGSGMAGATVTFNGYPAPLIYAGAGQINAVVPYEVAGAGVARGLLKNDQADSPRREGRGAFRSVQVLTAMAGKRPGELKRGLQEVGRCNPSRVTYRKDPA